MKTIVVVPLLAALFLFWDSDLCAQASWTKYPGNPVMTGGASYSSVLTPCVIYNNDSSRYEMWFSATPSPSGARPFRIGFAVSRDGIGWTMHPSPVLAPSGGMWDAYTVEAPYVIRENRQYKMWYWGGAAFPATSIGYATSPDGVTWTKPVGNPVLSAGTSAWEAGSVGLPCVMAVPGGYRMWYAGATTSMQYGPLCIGLATSADGISWQKDTTHNPILHPGNAGSWDDSYVSTPRVVRLGNLYFMWYTGAGTWMGEYRGGLATSPDGITGWVKDPANPVLRPSQSGWDGGEVEAGSVVARGDTLYMWYDAAATSPYAVGRIGLAESRLATSVEDGGGAPSKLILAQNYPNPFNPTTTIRYELPRAAEVRLSVSDVLGREVSVLVDEWREAGAYEATFDGTSLASGVYVYRLMAGDVVQTRKLVLVR